MRQSALGLLAAALVVAGAAVEIGTAIAAQRTLQPAAAAPHGMRNAPPRFGFHHQRPGGIPGAPRAGRGPGFGSLP